MKLTNVVAREVFKPGFDLFDLFLQIYDDLTQLLRVYLHRRFVFDCEGHLGLLAFYIRYDRVLIFTVRHL